MPNWCSNAIIISGNLEDVKRLDTQFKGKYTAISGGTAPIPEDGQFIPREKNIVEYRETMGRFGKQITYIGKIEEVEGYSFSNFVPMTKDDFLNGWRDWAIDHWGTKWDLGKDDIEPINFNHLAIDPNGTVEIVYSFLTAWSPCELVVAAMAKQYPMLNFTHEYEEGGEGYAGKTTYEHGVEHTRLESTETNYREFCAEVLGHEGFSKCEKCNSYYYEGDECDECEE